METSNTDERAGLDSASSFDRTVNCPGWRSMVARIPPEELERTNPENPDAERGTRIHAAFETGNTDKLSEDEIEDYQLGLKFNDQIVAAWMADKGIRTVKEGPREYRVWVHDDNLNPIASAKMDRHYLAPPYMCIIDLKSGWTPNLVPSPRSWQMRIQAIGAWAEYEGIEEIRVGFSKPKSKYGASDVTDYVQTDLEFSQMSARYHVWAGQQPDAPKTAGKWCDYCPAKAFCETAGAYALLPSVIAGRSVQLSSKEDVILAVESLAPIDLLKLWRVSTITGHIFEAVKGRLRAMPKEELADLGLEIAPGRKLDPITNVKGAMDFLKEKGIEEDDLWLCLTLNKGPLVDLARNAKSLTKEGAGKWLASELAPFITKQEGAGAIRAIK